MKRMKWVGMSLFLAFALQAAADDFPDLRTTAGIAKLSWVDKNCRRWAADGDIDVDQTCLVVKTVQDEWIVIPNPYNDQELKEALSQMDRTDKWVKRFYALGGGEKPHGQR